MDVTEYEVCCRVLFQETFPAASVFMTKICPVSGNDPIVVETTAPPSWVAMMTLVSFAVPRSKVRSQPKDAGGVSVERELAAAGKGKEKRTPIRNGAKTKRYMQREKTCRIL
jgi:hypothetical protein